MLKQAFLSYLDHIRRIGKSIQAVQGIKQRVRMLVRYFSDRDSLYLSIREAREYLADLQRRELSTKTIVCYLQACVSFYDYLRETRQVADNPFRAIRKPTVPATLPRHVPKEQEMDSFLEQLHDLSAELTTRAQADRYRAAVIAELLYSSGMRISEAAALEVSDLDLEKGLVFIRQGKGGSNRTAYLNEYCRAVLSHYLRDLRPLVLNKTHDQSLLFGTKWNGLSQFMNRQLAKVTKYGPVTCHTFRHAVGYHLLRSGCQVRYIQEILGHHSLRSTEVYTKIDKSALKNILDTCHPRQLTPRTPG